MSEQEQARTDKDRILNVIDENLKDNCTISSISINENTATVQITDCTLKTVSDCVGKISERDDIQNVSMRSAESADSNSKLDSALIVFTMKNAGENE